MKPIALFYHCTVQGGVTGVNFDFALSVISEQMLLLKAVGLVDVAVEFHIGVQGTTEDRVVLAILAGDKAKITCTCGEVASMTLLQKWLPGHEDWYVLWHHSKGVTHTNEPGPQNWRRRMQTVCVNNWRQCVADLDRGFDAVGAHWLTPEEHGERIKSPFFGGTFWWATAKYLLQLPQLPEPTWQNRFDAESWIGWRRPYPKVRDYFPGWP